LFLEDTLNERIETLNGVQLCFEVHGGGEPLILLHGFGGCGQDWSALTADWGKQFQLIIPDMRGHGRSSNPSKTFRHRESAADMFALLDHLGIGTFKGVGVSGGGNVLLHLATQQPERVQAMVLVSATSYFPAQARPIMRQYPDSLTEQDWETMRRHHPGRGRADQSTAREHRGFRR
jgi:pimeloyl-ACP methyl ester carboxylesterase